MLVDCVPICVTVSGIGFWQSTAPFTETAAELPTSTAGFAGALTPYYHGVHRYWPISPPFS